MTQPSCPSRVIRHLPFFASQSLRVLSVLAETMRCPSGEKAQA